MSNYSSHKQDDSSIAEVIIALLLTIPLMMWSGFVAMVLWNWFVPSVFSSAPTLSLWQAVGINLVVSMFAHQRNKANEEGRSVLEDAIYTLLYSGIMLGLGALVHGVFM